MDYHRQVYTIKYLIYVIFQDDRYSGRNNTLVMEAESTLEFTCQFQLQMYPVDRQKCFLLFTLPGLSKDFGLLMKVSMLLHSLGSWRERLECGGAR